MKRLSLFFTLCITCCAAKPYTATQQKSVKAIQQTYATQPIPSQQTGQKLVRKYEISHVYLSCIIDNIDGEYSKLVHEFKSMLNSLNVLVPDVIEFIQQTTEAELNHPTERPIKIEIIAFLYNNKEAIRTIKGLFAHEDLSAEDEKLNAFIGKFPEYLTALITNDRLMEKIKMKTSGVAEGKIFTQPLTADTKLTPQALKDIFYKEKERILGWFQRISSIRELITINRGFDKNTFEDLKTLVTQLGGQPENPPQNQEATQLGKTIRNVCYLLEAQRVSKLSPTEQTQALNNIQNMTRLLQKRLETCF